MSRAKAILKLPEEHVPLLISRARSILSAMQDNPAFPSPDPPLETLAAAIEALASAQASTHMRTLGEAAARDNKRRDLEVLLDHLRAYVQKIADADNETAAHVIESAAMYVKKPRVLPRRVFAAKLGGVSGSVKLVAPKAGNRVAYEWAYSVDEKKTWVTLPVTVQASTVVRGLLRASMVYFRYRTATKDGVGDWSDPVMILVE